MTTTTAASTWHPIDQAAVALGVSRRTVQRRIAAGELQATTHDDGRTWVMVPLDQDKRAEALVGLQAVERNEVLAQQLVESQRGTLALFQGRVDDLEAEVSRQRRAARWGWVAAAAGLVTVAGLAARWGVTAGHLSATVTQLEVARQEAVEQEVALAVLQGDLKDARQGATAATRSAEASRQEAEELRDRLACLTDELEQVEQGRDWVYLLTGTATP